MARVIAMAAPARLNPRLVLRLPQFRAAGLRARLTRAVTSRPSRTAERTTVVPTGPHTSAAMSSGDFPATAPRLSGNSTLWGTRVSEQELGAVIARPRTSHDTTIYSHDDVSRL